MPQQSLYRPRRAVAEGSLPASALDDSDSDSDSDSESGSHSRHKHKSNNDDERHGTQYNYTLFHVIFMLATCWVASLLVSSVAASENNGGSDANMLDDEVRKDLVAVGRTYWASWVKIFSAWVCYAIYIWSLIAPMVLPHRFDN